MHVINTKSTRAIAALNLFAHAYLFRVNENDGPQHRLATQRKYSVYILQCGFYMYDDGDDASRAFGSNAHT